MKKTKNATGNERKERISQTKSTAAMIQSEPTSALKIQKGRYENARGRGPHVGMVVESVPSSEFPVGGGWPEPLLIPSTGDVFGAGPLPF